MYFWKQLSSVYSTLRCDSLQIIGEGYWVFCRPFPTPLQRPPTASIRIVQLTYYYAATWFWCQCMVIRRKLIQFASIIVSVGAKWIHNAVMISAKWAKMSAQRFRLSSFYALYITIITAFTEISISNFNFQRRSGQQFNFTTEIRCLHHWSANKLRIQWHYDTFTLQDWTLNDQAPQYNTKCTKFQYLTL